MRCNLAAGDPSQGSPVPRRRSRRGNDPALQLDSSQREPHLLNDRILRRCDLPLFFFHGFAVLFFCFTISAQKLAAMGDAVPHTPCPLFCKKAGQKTFCLLRPSRLNAPPRRRAAPPAPQSPPGTCTPYTGTPPAAGTQRAPTCGRKTPSARSAWR